MKTGNDNALSGRDVADVLEAHVRRLLDVEPRVQRMLSYTLNERLLVPSVPSNDDANVRSRVQTRQISDLGIRGEA